MRLHLCCLYAMMGYPVNISLAFLEIIMAGFESLLRQLEMKLIRQKASVVETEAQIASLRKVTSK